MHIHTNLQAATHSTARKGLFVSRSNFKRHNQHQLCHALLLQLCRSQEDIAQAHHITQ